MKLAALLLVALSCSAAAQSVIVNVDATRYGFAFPTDPAPVVGQIITPITNPAGAPLNQVTLPAGTYTITNAAGLPGADPAFVAWNYSGGWVWSIVIADDATHAVVFYADAGGVRGSAAEIAADPAVRNLRGSFTLTTTTTLDLMIRDYFLPDNAGGVAVLLSRACPADFNGDGFLDFFDYDDYVNCFENAACPPGRTADFNGDGFADFFDYADFVAGFETGC